MGGPAGPAAGLGEAHWAEQVEDHMALAAGLKIKRDAALRGPAGRSWLAAEGVEMEAHEHNSTWVLVVLEDWMTMVGCRFVYAITDGRFKVRLVPRASLKSMAAAVRICISNQRGWGDAPARCNLRLPPGTSRGGGLHGTTASVREGGAGGGEDGVQAEEVHFTACASRAAIGPTPSRPGCSTKASSAV